MGRKLGQKRPVNDERKLSTICGENRATLGSCAASVLRAERKGIEEQTKTSTKIKMDRRLLQERQSAHTNRGRDGDHCD